LKYLKTLIRRGKAVGLDVLAGDEFIMGHGLLAGAKGIVPVCANYDPQRYVRLYEAGIRGDRKAVAAQMPDLLHIREVFLLSGASWLAGMKYAMSVLGYGSGKCVSPLESAEIERQARIAALIKTHQDGAATPQIAVRRPATTAARKATKTSKGRK
jgi:dihydrodipicolinate synthase/N-acetylneuraminate lyase